MSILKEPFLHFVVLGIAIFAAYALISEGDDAGQIVVTSGQQENLIATFEQTWQRPPTADEFRGLVEDFIRQEIAYREAGEMQLDRNDIVIRRRLRQKLELLTEDLASMAPPTAEEIEAYYAEHPENYRTDPRYTFQQIFFSTDRRGEQARDDALALLAEIESGSVTSAPAMAGDAISLPQGLRDASRREVAATFGSNFADALAELPEDRWSGPVESGYGVHLVRIADKVESRVPPLDNIGQAVRNDLLSERRSAAVETLYENLAANYTISVEPLGGPQAQP
jgi:hypothetical protein